MWGQWGVNESTSEGQVVLFDKETSCEWRPRILQHYEADQEQIVGWSVGTVNVWPGGSQQRSAAGMTYEETTVQPPDAAECLKERKWWCFVLSSIFTFLAGLLIVLLWRAFAFLCCRKEPEFAPNDPKQKEQKAARQNKEFEGTFMTEAKDWAGELISGQTTTGRILVSSFIYLFFPSSFINTFIRYFYWLQLNWRAHASWPTAGMRNVLVELDHQVGFINVCYSYRNF